MNNDIRTLQPAALWQNFYSLTRIPRPSGLKEQIGTFLLEYGKSLGLESFRDEIGNVIVRKPATPGYEDKPGVILQAHMDMVPQKANNLEFDFEKDPIDAHIAEDGQWVTASGTTLGADNGIGVAAAMAVLADKSLKHPALEMFITCDEETGMYGAFDLKGGVLQGKTLINLDSETEGELFVGCAGGVDADITFRYDEVPTESGDAAILLHVGGLHGGHSGIDIRLQRANANKLMFRFLRKAIAEYEARLVCVDGGGLRNAIPFDCKAVICVPREGVAEVLDLVAEYESLYVNEYMGVEDSLFFKAQETDMPAMMMPEMVQDDLVNALIACPNGVFRVMPDMPEMVETSNNMARVVSDGSTIQVKCLTRSSSESHKFELAEMIQSVFAMAGAQVELSGSYPGWKLNPNSPLLAMMKEQYKKQFGQDAKVMTIHAGLECGIIGRNYPDMDMVSFGPTIEHPHSPAERVNIQTVQKFWDFLVALLEAF